MRGPDDQDQLLRALVEDLADHVVVAKNPDIWASYRRGADWDLVVRSLPSARDRVVSVLGEPQTCVRRSYVWALDYGWCRLDLLPRIEWRGICLVDAARVFSGAEACPTPDGGGLPVARPAHQAMAACIYPVLAHGSTKDRYSPLWEEAWAADGQEMAAVMGEAFGTHPLRGRPLSDVPRAQHLLRRRAVAQALRRSPTTTVSGMARFAAAELGVRTDRFRTRPPVV